MVHGNLLRLAGKYDIPGLEHLSLEKSRAAIRDEPEIRALIECIPKVDDPVMDPGRKIFNLLIESISERIGSSPLDLDTRNILNSTMLKVPDFARGLAMSFVKQQLQNEDADMNV